MTPSSSSMVTELAPTIASLLGTVQSNALASISAAQTEASAHLQSAQTEASAILARARSDGDASAALASAATVIAAGRAGREMVLDAQRRVYEALQQGIRDELLRRAESPAGAAFFIRLEGLARASLGPNALIARREDGCIGVRATLGKRRVDISADQFIERELAVLGVGLAALWQ